MGTLQLWKAHHLQYVLRQAGPDFRASPDDNNDEGGFINAAREGQAQREEPLSPIALPEPPPMRDGMTSLDQFIEGHIEGQIEGADDKSDEAPAFSSALRTSPPCPNDPSPSCPPAEPQMLVHRPTCVYQPNCMRCDGWGSGVRLDGQGQVHDRELVCLACGALAPPIGV